MVYQKLPHYGRVSRSSLVITRLQVLIEVRKSSSRVAAVQKSKSWETCEITGESALRDKTFCFRGCEPRAGKVVAKKCRTVARARRLGLQNVKNWRSRSTFGRSGRQNVHETGHKVVKDAILGVARNRSHCQRCANVARFVTLLHAGLQPTVTKRIGTAARSKAFSAAVMLLASAIAAAWRLLNALEQLRVEKNWVQKLQKS